MEDDPKEMTREEAGLGEPVSASSATDRSATTDDEAGIRMDRLPPPAFPPGRRRDSRATVPEGRIRPVGHGIPDDAFISPDEPILRFRKGSEGTVTGIGEGVRAPYPPTDGKRAAPTIHELPYLLNQLASKIQESGMRALEIRPDTGHFHAALAAFLRGYLEGTRD